MKKTIFLLVCTFITTLCFSQNVGIGTNQPTEKLDVNGNLRLRNVPNIAKPRYLMALNDTGKAYRFPYDSLPASTSGSLSDLITVNFISGDTIAIGDFVAVGDGASGILRVNTYNFPYSTISFPTTQTQYAQTFITTDKATGIKAISLDLEIQAAGVPSVITCSIRNMNAGLPIGSDINGQTAVLDGPSGNGFYTTFGRIVFDPVVPIFPNTTYAVIIKIVGGAYFYTWLHSQSLGMYAPGHRCTSTNGGVTWTSQTNEDINCLIYETQTESGKVYRTDPALPQSIGANTVNGCLEVNGCPSTFFGQNDQKDNPIGVAMNSALPGQTVTVQLVGRTNLVTGFPVGKKLYMASPPGKVATTGTKVLGLSLGNGALIQITY